MSVAPSGALIRPFDVTHRMVLRLAAPMVIAYLSVPLVGVIDTAVIAQLGVAALIGGVAVGAIILDVVFVVFNFLRSGTTGLTAQAFGAEDKPNKPQCWRAPLCSPSSAVWRSWCCSSRSSRQACG